MLGEYLTLYGFSGFLLGLTCLPFFVVCRLTFLVAIFITRSRLTSILTMSGVLAINHSPGGLTHHSMTSISLAASRTNVGT